MPNLKHELNIKFRDVRLEDDVDLPRQRIGCFVSYQGDFVDVLMIKEGGHQVKRDHITVPLDEAKGDPNPKLTFLVKDIANDEDVVGSLSIPKSILLDGEKNLTYSMWLTLFDDPNDDEYDGAMGI